MMLPIIMTIVLCSTSAAFAYFAQVIQDNLKGANPESFTLVAVAKLDGNVAGYVHCTRSPCSESSSLASYCFNFFCLFLVSRKWAEPESGCSCHRPEAPNQPRRNSAMHWPFKS